MKKIPTFAVAGQPNAGKSTVVATLSEDDAVKISNVAGLTKKATHYKATLDNKPVMDFIDLPGFENTPYVLDWLEDNKDSSDDLAEKFVNEHLGIKKFKPECSILQSIQGAAVILVVDASQEPSAQDRYHAEILYQCNDKCIGIINLKNVRSGNSQDEAILKKWEKALRKAGLTYHFFNPHRANFEDRIELLDKISHIIPGWRKDMQIVIRALEKDWQVRMENIRDQLSKLLHEVIKYKESGHLNNNEDKAREAATKKVKGKIRALEKEFREQVRKQFNHRKADWKLPQKDILDEDLFSQTTWEMFGLTQTELILTTTAIGALIGGGIDIMLGGFSLGLGTLIGSLSGAALGVAAANMENAIDVLISNRMAKILVKGVFMPKTTFEAEVAVGSNLIWILLDRALLYAQAAANWSHGNRARPQDISDKKIKAGQTTKWSKDNKKLISEWLAYLRKKDRKNAASSQKKVNNFLLKEVNTVTSGGAGNES